MGITKVLMEQSQRQCAAKGIGTFIPPPPVQSNACIYRSEKPYQEVSCGCSGVLPVDIYRCSLQLVHIENCIPNKVGGKRLQTVKDAGLSPVVCTECEYRIPPPTVSQSVSVVGTNAAPSSDWPQFSEVPLPSENIKPIIKKQILGLEAQRSGTQHLNGSIIEFQGRILFVYRFGWGRCRIHLCELDKDYRVMWERILDIPRLYDNAVQSEDPRLFIHTNRQGTEQLWLSFTGVRRVANSTSIVTTVMLAYLTPELKVGFAGPCQYGSRRGWEKNWGFFTGLGDSHNLNSLYAIYDINPQHTILFCENLPDEPTTVPSGTPLQFHLHELSDNDLPKPLGLLRGGASPLRYEGEYWSIAHGVYRYPDGSNDKHYQMCLYTFESRCPFKPSRVLPLPLLIPEKSERPQPHQPHCVYPCGAFLKDNKLIVSYGYYDMSCWVVEYHLNHIQGELQTIPGSTLSGLSFREGWLRPWDMRIWSEVNFGNEYRIPEKFEDTDIIVDVGAHIGSFSKLCLDRGVGKVFAYEPNRDAFSCLEENLAEYVGLGKADIHNGRCGRYGKETEGIGDNINLTECTLPLHTQRIRLMKIDCEGGEYDILSQYTFENVEEIVGETHEVNGHTHEEAFALLRMHGFKVYAEPTGVNLSYTPTDPYTMLFWARR